MADYSKAFNRQDHNTLITILSDMGCPRWLLEIIIAFLSDRKLIVRQRGKQSSRQHLPGGTPQGTRLPIAILQPVPIALFYPHAIALFYPHAIPLFLPARGMLIP